MLKRAGNIPHCNLGVFIENYWLNHMLPKVQCHIKEINYEGCQNCAFIQPNWITIIVMHFWKWFFPIKSYFAKSMLWIKSHTKIKTLMLIKVTSWDEGMNMYLIVPDLTSIGSSKPWRAVFFNVKFSSSMPPAGKY